MKVKFYILTSLLLVSLFSVSFSSDAYAGLCVTDPSECNANEYICENGTMCCTEGGCPSWECEAAKYKVFDEGRWQCCIQIQDADPFCTDALLGDGTCRYCGGGEEGGGGGGNYCTCTAEQNCSAANTGPVCGTTSTGGTKVLCKKCPGGGGGGGNFNITGYLFETAGSCNESPSGSAAIVGGEVSGDITLFSSWGSGGVNGTWDSSDGSFRVNGIPTGKDYSVTTSIPPTTDDPPFDYELACLKGQNITVGGITVNTGNYFTPLPPNTVLGDALPNQAGGLTVPIHFGYTKNVISEAWFTTINGDVYGGCENCGDSISVSFPPSPATILGGFADIIIHGVGTVFSNDGISGENYSQDNNRNVKGMGQSEFWPEAFTFVPPTAALPLPGTPAAGEVYSVSTTDLQATLDSLAGGNYTVSGDGVAVVYVTGAGDTLTFDYDYKSSNSNRMLFIVEGQVEIGSDVGYDVAITPPTSASSVNIDASIIAQGTIKFLHSASAEFDTKVVFVEGPLVSKDGIIDFNRDLGTNVNELYPAEVVRYNPIYLTELSKALLPGITTVTIDWVLGN